MIVFVVISIPRFSQHYFLIYLSPFNGRQMMAFEGKKAGQPPLSASMGCLLSELWHYIFYPISQGMTSPFI